MNNPGLWRGTPTEVEQSEIGDQSRRPCGITPHIAKGNTDDGRWLDRLLRGARFVTHRDMEPIDALRQYFGFHSFRGQQETIIQRVLSGGHSLVIMPTGGGKSLCYQIPALLFDSDADQAPEAFSGSDGKTSITLVLSPLIALMKDQVDALRARGIAATFINSSLSREDRERRYADVARGKYRLLHVTP